MRNILYLLFVLLFTSCGTTYHLSTLNYDPIYGPDGTEIKVDTIDNEFQLARKFRTDDRFRWDFAQFAMRQDMRWNYDFYFNNRMHRSGFGSPFAFHWNSNQYWWNWANNSHFNMGFNHWDIFGFYGNSYGWNNGYYGNGWNNGYYGNGWGYNSWNNGPWNNNGYNVVWNRSRENVSYNIGRRGSNNVVSNRTIENKIIVNRNKPRNENFVIEEDGVRWYASSENDVDNDEIIDKALIKLRGNNTNIRVYNNPNNVPPVIIRNNNNSKPIRNYNRVENNSNNNIIRNNNNSRPIRTYSPPSRSSSPPVINRSSSNGRSSSPPPTSRGGSNIKR